VVKLPEQPKQTQNKEVGREEWVGMVDGGVGGIGQ